MTVGLANFRGRNSERQKDGTNLFEQAATL
jgi:hypothetical protein